MIGGNDLFIAAHAIALDCTLVTDNVREFERVDGLRRELATRFALTVPAAPATMVGLTASRARHD
jgi:hypothetical protein